MGGGIHLGEFESVPNLICATHIKQESNILSQLSYHNSYSNTITVDGIKT